MKELKGELSGKLCTAVMAMGEPSDEYDASELRKVSIHSKYDNNTANEMLTLCNFLRIV